MNVLEATLEDVPALSELLGILFAQEAEFEPNLDLQAAGLRLIIGDPSVGRVLVLKDGGIAIGMVSLIFHPSTALGGRVAILEDLIVHPDRRGGGAGGQLISAAKLCAKEYQCLRMSLLTDGANTSAQRFYQRHGFAHSEMITMRMMMDE